MINQFGNNSYTVKDVFDFVKEVPEITSKLNIDPSKVYMASLDIEAMYPSIPLKEVSDIVIKKAFPLRNLLFHGLNEAQFTQ